MQVLYITVGEVQHIIFTCSLEPVDGLIVVAYDKHIRVIPEIDEQFHHLILGSAGILVFIHQDVLIFFLVAAQQVFILPKSPDHPVDHIIIIVASFIAHQLLVTVKFVYGCTQFGHAFGLFLEFGLHRLALLITGSVFLIGVLITGPDFFQVFIYFGFDKCRCITFPFHRAEQGPEIFHFEIGVAAVAFQRMFLGEAVCQLP